MLLENFRPQSKLVTKTTLVNKPKFPVIDAHNHLALTYKRDPENNSYYLTSVLDSTAIRAIQAVSCRGTLGSRARRAAPFSRLDSLSEHVH